MVEVKDLDLELVAKPEVIQLHLRDHGKPVDVAKALAQKNYLKPESQGHYKKRPQKGIKQPFYLITSVFLGCNIATDF